MTDKKAFLVNLDVVVIAEDEDDAKKQAMRVAPNIHKEENNSKETRVVYTNERLICPNCNSLNINANFGYNKKGNVHKCNNCGLVFGEGEKQ